MIEDCIEISDCEEKLSPYIGNVKLLSEIVLSRDEVDILGALIKKEISVDIKQGIEHLENKSPISLACFLVWKGILDYTGGDYWSSIENSIGISDPNTQNRLGDLFIKFLKSNSLLYFEVKDAHKNIIPILFHGMIPNYCLNEYFEDILLPLFEDLTYLDVENEIKFWLKIYRQNNIENVNLKEEFNSLDTETYDKYELFESLVAVWDDFEKIKELEMKVYDTNQLNSLVQDISNYEIKKQIRIDLQKRILDLEKNIGEIKNK